MISMMRRFPHGIAIAAFLLALFAVNAAFAQGSMSGVPNAMQGFSQNRDQPIQIEAAALEMRDKKKEATFSGNVKVVQGDTTMTSKILVVFYEDKSTQTPGACAGRHQGRRRQGYCADAVGDARPRRRVLDQAAGSEGQCRRHPEGPGRHRRDRDLRYQDQSDHHARRWWRPGGADPVPERAARRPPAGRHDHRRLAGRIRQRQGAGTVHSVPGRTERQRRLRNAGRPGAGPRRLRRCSCCRAASRNNA